MSAKANARWRRVRERHASQLEDATTAIEVLKARLAEAERLLRVALNAMDGYEGPLGIGHFDDRAQNAIRTFLSDPAGRDSGHDARRGAFKVSETVAALSSPPQSAANPGGVDISDLYETRRGIARRRSAEPLPGEYEPPPHRKPPAASERGAETQECGT